MLNGVSHVVIDEVHERDINIDFLLLIVRCTYGCAYFGRSEAF